MVEMRMAVMAVQDVLLIVKILQIILLMIQGDAQAVQIVVRMVVLPDVIQVVAQVAKADVILPALVLVMEDV